MPAPPVKSGYVTNGANLQINYLEWGKPDAPPVVLIIGLTGAAYNWRTTAEALQNDYRVIAINIRGHGDSGPFLDRNPAALSLEYHRLSRIDSAHAKNQIIARFCPSVGMLEHTTRKIV